MRRSDQRRGSCYLTEVIARLAAATAREQNHNRQAKFLLNNLNGQHEIGIVRNDYRLLEIPIERIHEQ